MFDSGDGLDSKRLLPGQREQFLYLHVAAGKTGESIAASLRPGMPGNQESQTWTMVWLDLPGLVWFIVAGFNGC